MTFDDSALFHGANYDPQKAHEYYLRTRKLKGRKPGAGTIQSHREFKKKATGNEGTYARPYAKNRADTKSRQAELKRQKAALEARLDHLREVLAQLVDAAKKRSGVKDTKKDSKDTSSSSTAKKGGKDGKSEKLSASEKAKKNAKARKEYEKEHPTSLSTDVKELQAQIEDIQAKIKKALADARERRNKAGAQDSKSGSKNHQTSGPRGR